MRVGHLHHGLLAACLALIPATPTTGAGETAVIWQVDTHG